MMKPQMMSLQSEWLSSSCPLNAMFVVWPKLSWISWVSSKSLWKYYIF